MSLPAGDKNPDASAAPAISFEDVRCTFSAKGDPAQTYTAVDHTSLQVAPGEFVSVVGPTGCGKSTLLNVAAGLLQPSSGQVRVFGQSLGGEVNRRAGYMFQSDALMPWRSALQNVIAGLQYRGVEEAKAILLGEEWLQRVGLQGFGDRYPHQLSGGQQQRIAIARAMAVRPKLIVADEPLSSLDMSVQAQILNLLIELKTSRNLGLVLISHDLNVVDAISDRVIVMYLGKVVEAGPTRQVLGNPANDYTRSLLAAKLVADPHVARARRLAMDSAAASATKSTSHSQGASQ